MNKCRGQIFGTVSNNYCLSGRLGHSGARNGLLGCNIRSKHPNTASIKTQKPVPAAACSFDLLLFC
eukprot:7703544-Lingulodinium_polyedra.AAC.1